jgi:hypothetical protein
VDIDLFRAHVRRKETLKTGAPRVSLFPQNAADSKRVWRGLGPRKGHKAEKADGVSMSNVFDDVMRFVDGFSIQEWMLFGVIAVLIGIFFMRGSGSQSSY